MQNYIHLLKILVLDLEYALKIRKGIESQTRIFKSQFL